MKLTVKLESVNINGAITALAVIANALADLRTSTIKESNGDFTDSTLMEWPSDLTMHSPPQSMRANGFSFWLTGTTTPNE